jgi:hypothetical protein
MRAVFRRRLIWKPATATVKKGHNSGTFQEKKGAWVRDVQVFALIFFEVMVGGPPRDEMSIPTGIPDFVAKIIKVGYLQHPEEVIHSI